MKTFRMSAISLLPGFLAVLVGACAGPTSASGPSAVHTNTASIQSVVVNVPEGKILHNPDMVPVTITWKADNDPTKSVTVYACIQRSFGDVPTECGGNNKGSPMTINLQSLTSLDRAPSTYKVVTAFVMIGEAPALIGPTPPANAQGVTVVPVNIVVVP